MTTRSVGGREIQRIAYCTVSARQYDDRETETWRRLRRVHDNNTHDTNYQLCAVPGSGSSSRQAVSVCFFRTREAMSALAHGVAVVADVTDARFDAVVVARVMDAAVRTKQTNVFSHPRYTNAAMAIGSELYHQ